jgi:integrase
MVTVPPFLCDLLDKHLARQPASDFVFTSIEGALLRRSNFARNHFKPALKAAKVDPGVRFHDLRHTCAALMIESGAHPKEIQARLGHSSIKTTLDLYAHLMPSLGAHLNDALEATRQEARLDFARPGRGLSVVSLDTTESGNVS